MNFDCIRILYKSARINISGHISESDLKISNATISGIGISDQEISNIESDQNIRNQIEYILRVRNG